MKQYGLVSRLRAAVGLSTDGNNAQFRSNQLGEIFNAPDGQLRYALEGSYFVTSTPTPGTGVALGVAAATSVVATAPSLLIKNTDSAGGKDILLRRLQLICTAAGTAGAALDCLIVIDSNPSRYTSGGVAMTPVNIKSDSAVATIAQVYNASTAIVAAAAGAGTRQAARARIRTGIPVVGDTYRLSFGAEPTTESGLLSGTGASLFAHGLSPIVVPPQCVALVYLWSAAQTAAPTYEVELQHVER